MLLFFGVGVRGDVFVKNCKKHVKKLKFLNEFAVSKNVGCI